jgi:hypothetical protein
MQPNRKPQSSDFSINTKTQRISYLDIFDFDNVELLQGVRMLRIVDITNQIKDFPLVKIVLYNKKDKFSILAVHNLHNTKFSDYKCLG